VAKLTTATKKKLSKSDFVEKSGRKYPIPDAAHATGCFGQELGKAGARVCGCGSQTSIPKNKYNEEEIVMSGTQAASREPRRYQCGARVGIKSNRPVVRLELQIVLWPELPI
jgi:hypothetical protein